VSGDGLLVGIDIGTTFCKAAVVRAADGTEVAHGAAPTPWTVVPTGPSWHRNGCSTRPSPRPRPPWSTPPVALWPVSG